MTINIQAPGGAVVAATAPQILQIKTDLGLDQVNNTPDSGKGVSGPQAAAIATRNVNIQFQNEGSPLGTPGTVDTLNVIGALVSASRVGNVVTLEVQESGNQTPVALAANTNLTEALHAGRDLFVTSGTPVTLFLPPTAATGARFFGVNLGAGAVSIVLSGGGAIPANALLPATIDQFSAFEVKRHAGGFVRVA